MIGAGKYDNECTAIMEHTRASAVLMIVLEGDRGTGFSVNAFDPGLHLLIPRLLRELADEIEQLQNS